MKQVATRTFVLRGYVTQREDGRFVGVCLKPNLVVESASEDAAFRQLRELIATYVLEAAKDGHLDHFMSQRAPSRFYVEYFVGRCKRSLKLLNSAFLTFTESKPVSACIA